MVLVHVDGRVFDASGEGGIKRVFSNLLSRLAVRNDVQVRLYLRDQRRVPECLVPLLQVTSVPAVHALRPARIFATFNSRRSQRAVASMWRDARSGVFHSTYYSTHETVAVPQVLTMQDTIVENYPACFAPDWRARHLAQKARALRAANAVVFASEAGRQEAARFYAMEGKATEIIPYAVEQTFVPCRDDARLEAFAARHVAGWPYLLFVGRRWAHKNFVGLMSAYARWPRRREFAFLFAGGGDPTEVEMGAIECLGLSGRVHFAPTISDADLVTAYNAATATVIPALSEGFGLPLLEAMSCGVPVASSTGGALPEVGGDVPVYFDPQDAEDIVRALDEVVVIDRLGERTTRGVARARRRTWDDVAADYARLYGALAAGRPFTAGEP